MATVAQAADHIFISERRFYEMLDQGIIDRAPAGQYDLDIVREQCLEHLRAVAAGRAAAGENGFDLTDERARLAKEQADAQEMKNAVQRRELLPRGEVHAAVTAAFSRVRSKLIAVPSKVAPVVIHLGTIAEVREKVSDGINEALAELAATVVAGVPVADGEPSSAGGGTGLVDDFDAAADADGEPVGGSGTTPEPGSERGAGAMGYAEG